MISRLGVRLRWCRRVLGRTYWAARFLGITSPEGEAELPGVIILQIDGLARTQLERALAGGDLPFLKRLIQRQHFTLETFYSGVPSTTPAVQGEIFFGIRSAVPGFQFLHRQTGRVFRMYEAAAAETIEQQLLSACPDPLLTNGHSYSNIYRAGATLSRYCSQDLDPHVILQRLHPAQTLLLAAAYTPRLLRLAALTVLEFALALIDAVKGLYAREDIIRELVFVPTRVLICIVLRELIRFRVFLDIERGIQVIHANFLGYDEQAHRRGPDSAFAHWTLKGIDRTIRDLYRAAARSSHRDYEVMIYSDHGQERTIPFAVRHGRPLEEALAAIFARGPLASHPLWSGNPSHHAGQPQERGHRQPSPAANGQPDPATHIIVTAMGPVGHVYFPVRLSDDELEAYALPLVAEAGVPLVLFRTESGTVRAFNARHHGPLPDERTSLLGADHPFLEEATADLIQLCQHPDAGDIVLSGWDPAQQPLTFATENGAHGGPGSEETRGFLLVPDRIQRWHTTHIARSARRVRGEDLHQIALHFLGRDPQREERAPHHQTRQPQAALRVMTYNIHSCTGIDGKVRPERIARVINSFDADVVAVQEIDAHRPRSGHHDQTQLIAGHLRMEHVFHALLEEEKERYGIAILARHPFKTIKSACLTPSHHRYRHEARGAIWILLEMEGRRPVHIINTHFGLRKEERRQQTEILLGRDWLGAIPNDEPVILCGDFNAGPRSFTCQQIQKRLRDVQEAASHHKPRATFSSVQPLVRIDHIFVSPHFSVERVHVPDTPSAMTASDHLPLCVELGT